MAEVVVFHHTLGLTAPVRRFADELRGAGHTVHTPDLYGTTFETYDDGRAHFETLGERMAAVERARAEVASCRRPFLCRPLLRRAGGAVARSDTAGRERRNHHVIPPPAQRTMAERIGATVTETPGSHAIYVSNPTVVADLITQAARSALRETTAAG